MSTAVKQDPALEAGDRQARRRDMAAGLFVLALTVFRFWYAGRHELVQDEAYYWQWGRHLDWGYYDNTPLAALVIRAFTTLLGSTEVGVRAGAIVSAAVISLFVYLLARRLLGSDVALFAVVLANLIPLFGAGAILMTHDPVQLALWSACLYVVHLALTPGPAPKSGRGEEEGSRVRPGWGRWVLAGVLAGLAAEAKLNALLLLPGVFLYLLLSPTARERWLRRPQPYVAGVIALALFAPFVWWNHTHDNAFWIHIHAMGTRSSGHDGLKWFFRFLGDQAALLSPLIFLAYLYTLWAYRPRRPLPGSFLADPPRSGEGGAGVRSFGLPLVTPSATSAADPATTFPPPLPPREGSGFSRGVGSLPGGDADALLFLWCPSMVVFAATALESLHSKVEGNWAVAAYATGTILVAAMLARAWEPGSGGRVWAGLGVGLAALMTLVIYFPVVLYSVGVKFPKPKDDRTNELYGWRTMAARIQQEERTMGGDPFVFGINYRMPSEAAFYLPGQPQTYSLFLHDRANEYRFWEDPRKLVGRNAVFVNDTETPDHLDDVRAVFGRVEVEPPLRIYRDPPYGRTPVRTVQIFRCYGFKGYDVKKWQDGW